MRMTMATSGRKRKGEGGGIGHASLAKLPPPSFPDQFLAARLTDGRRHGVTRVFLLFRPRRRSHAYLFLFIWDPEFLLMHQAIGMILYDTTKDSQLFERGLVHAACGSSRSLSPAPGLFHSVSVSLSLLARGRGLIML